MKTRLFYLDLLGDDITAVTPGDLLVGALSVQLVITARPTETRTDRNRWTLRVRTIATRPKTRDDWTSVRSHARPGALVIYYNRRPRHQ